MSELEQEKGQQGLAYAPPADRIENVGVRVTSQHPFNEERPSS